MMLVARAWRTIGCAEEGWEGSEEVEREAEEVIGALEIEKEEEREEGRLKMASMSFALPEMLSTTMSITFALCHFLSIALSSPSLPPSFFFHGY